MRKISRAKSRILGLTMVAVLVASPLAAVSVLLVAGCIKEKSPGCGCESDNSLFSAGMLAVWLLGNNEAGRTGISCWDLNANGNCDLATEDVNLDGVCNAVDCLGAPGEAGRPTLPIDGLSCWDANVNGVCDLPAEDINGDGVCNALDCRGGPGANGTTGPQGPGGPAGPAGPAVDPPFDIFIEDFFTYGAISDAVSGQGAVIGVKEPVLGDGSLASSYGPIAFRVAIPEVYGVGNPVTLRIFLWREAQAGQCMVLRLDTFRVFEGVGVSQYGVPLYLRLQTGAMSNPGMLVVDLPLNTLPPQGLGFSPDLFAAQILAFELSVFTTGDQQAAALDGRYTVLGAELFESAASATTEIKNVTVFTTTQGIGDFCTVCDPDGVWQGQCNDGDPATLDICQPLQQGGWGECYNIAL